MKIMMICNTDGALYVFRRPIIEAALQRGHSVHTLSGNGKFVERLRDLGVVASTLEFPRHSVGLGSNLRLLLSMWRALRTSAPDVVHSFTHKPAIYGTLAAWLAGVPTAFVTITGLGTLFIRNDIKAVVLRKALLLQYRLTLPFARRVYFQNPDDLAYFTSHGIISADKACLTGGSGIDLEKYPNPTGEQVEVARARVAAELEIQLGSQLLVLFPARAVKEKGFFEFYQAAKILHKRHAGRYVFIHLGLVDAESSGAISRHEVEGLARNCGVYFLGFKDDIDRYMVASDIVALPSYREGAPRSLIEALALGKVVVTSDVPGCRETVLDNVTGLLCEPRSVDSLVDALEKVDSALCQGASKAARPLCEERFDVSQLIDTTLHDYGAHARPQPPRST